MSFIQDEINKIEKVLIDQEYGSVKWRELYIARQALAWALDPTGMCKSPYNMIMELGHDPSNGLIRAVLIPPITSAPDDAEFATIFQQ